MDRACDDDQGLHLQSRSQPVGGIIEVLARVLRQMSDIEICGDTVRAKRTSKIAGSDRIRRSRLRCGSRWCFRCYHAREYPGVLCQQLISERNKGK